MRAISILLMAVVLTASTVGLAIAETVYISDRLIVGIREVPEDSAPSISTLKSDDPVELLSEGEQYDQVRTADGIEGYIKKQYLTKERPKDLLIADLEKKLAREKKTVASLKESMSTSASDLQKNQAELQNRIKELEQQLAESKKLQSESSKQLETTGKELTAARQQYDKLQKDAADVVSIVKERETLQKENERLTDELNTMREDNVYLLTTFYIKWFLAGAGVLLVGWMIGRSGKRKRRY